MDDYYMYMDSLNNIEYPIKTKWIEDAEDALNFLKDRLDKDHNDIPNIIIIDKNLPGMDGIELLDEIKKKKLSKTSTLMVTGDKSDETYESA